MFFDLPMETREERKNYQAFRKGLITNGFFMLQKSVYCRMVLNKTSQKTVIDNLRKIRPPQGLVQILSVTEKQFSQMEFITGEYKSDVVDSDERLVIL